MTVFGVGYADAYDCLYADKDYDREAALLNRIFEGFATGPVNRILDLGCGTGTHAIHLAKRGFDVVGVDRSASMIRKAVHKSAWAGARGNPQFLVADIRNASFARPFDAVLMMFAVLSYQLEDAEVSAALANVRRHLTPGGVFVCDFWYGPAVLHQKPAERVRMVPHPAGRLSRRSRGELYTQRNMCRVDFDIELAACSGDTAAWNETHWMRYLFPGEVKHFFETAGLRLLRLVSAEHPERPADETTWNALAIGIPADSLAAEGRLQPT